MKRNWLESSPEEILVYNFEGEPIKRIKLNSYVLDIAISDKRNRIYLCYYNGEYFKIGYMDLD